MTKFSTDEARWAAIAARDPAADGAFVYAVTTTGVFCRPNCPSRRPSPANVRIFATPADAVRAGFRACLRCRPTEASQTPHAAAVAAACRQIEAAQTPPSLDTLAAAAGLSRFHFHRIFKSATGLTPKAYASAERARRARAELAGGASVTEAIYGAGFGSNGRFYAEAGERLGMPPRAWRNGGDGGAKIRFAVGETSLGAILVAATDKGICAIDLGDDPEKLVRGLQDRFPKAVLHGADPQFEALVAQVVGLVENPALGIDLPLDIAGSAFQERVWRALRAIPAGTTASYAEIAARIGAPGAARAVARACAANPAAIAIPCHRVVRTGGALCGYRWGVARKRALIAREAG
jgi:AraC family transcriptional regulator, regulatory protein of adaptative response / methylated-DNA-[protein]-cysteine methyltransferase